MCCVETLAWFQSLFQIPHVDLQGINALPPLSNKSLYHLQVALHLGYIVQPMKKYKPKFSALTYTPLYTRY